MTEFYLLNPLYRTYYLKNLNDSVKSLTSAHSIVNIAQVHFLKTQFPFSNCLETCKVEL